MLRMYVKLLLNKLVVARKPVEDHAVRGQFSLAYYIEWRPQASLLSRNELDLVMLGSTIATTRSDEDVIHGRHKPVKIGQMQVTYTMDVQCVRSPLASSLVLEGSTGSILSTSII